jgi:hypothetical protein
MNSIACLADPESWAIIQSGGTNDAKESVATFWFVESPQPDQVEQRAIAQQYAAIQLSAPVFPPYGAERAAKVALSGLGCRLR